MPKKLAKKIKKIPKEKEFETHPSYQAKDIYVLEGLEPVRKRPGMYIGSTGTDGLHHLVFECVDNSIDEAMAGYAKNIKVEILEGNRVSVTDDGRGIPIDIHPQTKKSALETVMTTLHAGGKFGGESYKVAGGLHGVGVSVVNALSKWLKVEVCRDGFVYTQEYNYGKPKHKVKKGAACKRRGTQVTFDPDPVIFKTIEFDAKKIIDHLRQQAYLTKSVRIDISDLRKKGALSYGFYFDGGLRSFLNYLIGNQRPIQKKHFYVSKEAEGIDVEIAFTYTDDVETEEISFANNIYTPDGGAHLTGFRTALTRTLNDYARKENIIKNSDENLTGEDIREGLIAAISIKLREPQFEGQTKARLGNPEARTAVETISSGALKEFLEQSPGDAKNVIAKNLLAAKARKAAKVAKDTVLRKGALEGLTLPGKLADCSSRKAEESELFIVEGDSAGGCFSGDTEVALADGRNLSFEKITQEHKEGKKNFCYTVKNDGNIGIALIKNPRITKKNTTVIKITLDNKEEIICTPDHKFMLRNGTFREAQLLEREDSLMPLYRKISRIGGYITIDGYEMIFNPSKHKWIFTHTLTDKYNLDNRECFEIKRSRQHHKDFNKHPAKNHNHKVKKTETLDKKISVYDLEVPETHNFALAGGVFVHNSAKSGRNRRTQAILPLRGKILNVEKTRIDKILLNKEIKSLIIALGTAISDSFDISKLRYHKVIIMTDADVDGAHIKTLLLTLFYRYFPQIIEGGFLYIAQPPLYKIQKGKESEYIYTEKDKNSLLKKWSALDAKINVQRYKGLGEMNPSQLWETTMDPEIRILKRVEIADAVETDKIFDVLMGGMVGPRKKFIQAHATSVKNLDI